MTGYGRGMDGPSLGADSGKDLLGLFWLVVVLLVALTVCDWAFPQNSAADGAESVKSQEESNPNN